MTSTCIWIYFYTDISAALFGVAVVSSLLLMPCPVLACLKRGVLFLCLLQTLEDLIAGIGVPVVRRPGLLLLPGYLTCCCLHYPGSAFVAH